MKRIISVGLMLVLCLACTAALGAASAYDVNEIFRRFASYTLDEETGQWSAHALSAAQMMRAVERGDVKDYMDRGIVAVYPSVRGHCDLALIEPVLNVALLRNGAIKPDGLSITTGGQRYDFVAEPVKGKMGAYACEQFALPLDERGMEMLRSMAKSGFALRIYGEGRTHRTSVRPITGDATPSKRERFEATSMQAVQEMLDLYPATYDLWAQNAGLYREARPELAVHAIDGAPYDEALPQLEPETQLLDTASKAAIRAYQKILYDHGFYAYKPDGNFGAKTRKATREAQQYVGLITTGQPDRALIECIVSGKVMPEEPKEPAVVAETAAGSCEMGAWYRLGDRLTVCVDAYHTARAVRATQAEGALGDVLPSDRSNILFVVRGKVVNPSNGALSIGYLVQAELTIDSKQYPCQALIERDNGASFGDELLPMQEAPLLLYAQVPVAALGQAMELTTECDGQSLTYFMDDSK